MRDGVELDRIVEEYRAGATFEQLGKKWSRDPSGIRRAMLRAGVALEDGQARIALGNARRVARDRDRRARRRAQVEQMHADGDSIEDIAQAVGYAESTVRAIIGTNKWRDEYGERNAHVVEVYQAGHTVAETARITGTQPTQVGRIVKRAGVSRRRGP